MASPGSDVHKSGSSWGTIYSTNYEEGFTKLIEFYNNNGIIIGHEDFPNSRYFALRTTNGGNTWLRSDFIISIGGISLINENVVYIGGNTGIYKSTNFGNSWSHISDLSTNDLLFVNDSIGFALGAHIYKTTNGGDTWDINLEEYWGYSDITCVNADTGFVTGGYGSYIDILYKTTNCAILPVELTSFSFTNTGNSIVLSWTTATETNNRGFEIQRSCAKQEFITIGFVKGNGTTAEQHNYAFTNDHLSRGSYSYRLKQYDFNGSFHYSDVVNVNFNIPLRFALEQNFPNPFNPSTVIKWQSPENCVQTLQIFDVLGNEVKTLIDEYRPAGSYEINLDASGLTSGVYFYRLTAGKYLAVKKMVLVR